MCELTKIIQRWHDGDKTAESQLYDFAYTQLYTIAQKERERSAKQYGTENVVLQDCANSTTALVHDAYVKLNASNRFDIQSRRQFYLLAAKIMRQILVDNARHLTAQKRQQQHAVSKGAEQSNSYLEQLLLVNKALDIFSNRYPRQSDVLKLKYFMGLRTKEISSLLKCSDSLVEKDLKFSKSWLQLQLQ